ncbi:MAG: Gfo/Idh/MocA family oxidoreductase [Planctomycetes bacterium]|nr:Gfo/Idh/MocA family oxidoreductase [Planctomycetota bacterium]
MAMRLGMLGMWHSHAQGLVREVLAHPDELQLEAAWDPDPDVVRERGAAWKARAPGLRICDGPEEVLRQLLDGVVVEGRVHENLRYARMALEAGFPVLLEKPAGHRLEEHRELIHLARAKHLHVQMIYLFRYMSAALEMLRRARSGELGMIYEFRARLPKQLPEYGRFEEELKLYRGGIFFEMAGHVIDMMVSVLGRPRDLASHMAHHHPRPGTFVDNGLAVFEYDHAFGIIEVPQLEVVPATRRIEVYGTKGALVIPHLGSGHLPNKTIQPVEVFLESKGEWERLDLPAATLHTSDLREFAAVAARKKEPEYSLEHDLVVQEWLLRASGMA